MKEESEKAGLKLNIHKTGINTNCLILLFHQIMASGPITSWQIDGETVESVRFHSLGLQNQCEQ